MPAYANLFERLTARCLDGDSGCWIGVDKTSTSIGYQQVDVWIPGLHDPDDPRPGNSKIGARRKLYAHIACWCWRHWECQSADELWLAYQELRASGLELDHTCENPACRNPDCLEPVTRTENEQRKHDRRAARRAARGEAFEEESEEVLAF